MKRNPANQPEVQSSHRKPATRLPLEFWAACLVWLIPMLIIGAMVIHNPARRTVTHLYHQASANWSAEKDLYLGPAGMNYLPHFAILFKPFELLPVPLGDLLWRFLAAAVLVVGIWRWLKLSFAEAAPQFFLWMSLLTIPLCLGALRNGQSNALFGAVTLNAVVCLARKQWWASAALIVLALAIKPLGVVLLLLAPIVYCPLRWRVALAVLGFIAFPFLFAKPAYVLAQHHAFIVNIKSCAVVTQHRFADINGIFRTFGAPIPPTASKFLRLFAGLGTAGLWWLGSRPLAEPLRALWLYLLAAAYLMLFNPMNESNSYVIFAPAAGFWVCYFLKGNASHKLGWITASMVLSMGLLPEPLRPLFRNAFALFWHPLMTAIFAVLATWHVLRLGHKEPIHMGLPELPGLGT